MKLRQLSLTVGVTSLIVCGTLSAQQENSPCPTAVVPARAGNLELVGWEKFPRAELGAVFRYRAVGAFAPDLYVYSADRTPDAEIADFKQGLEAFRNSGEFESFTVELEREVAVPNSELKGRHVAVELKRGNQTQRSHFYLFQHGGKSYKLRISYPEGRYEDAAVQGFVDALMKQLIARQQGDEPAP